ncbi:Exosome complex component rrp4 [Entomophthora muscae]|uniref:Exosome complex component rrp4 n=1 Tax=Entomophthora muscae TaxID=34485 RepID=A0ACC2T9A1_9FUNG|nr:Exosome complex component rrp4 [Entomophthora muscae]
MEITFFHPSQIPGRIDAAFQSEINRLLEKNSDVLEGKIVSPGDIITDDEAFMRGFGTYKDGEVIRSSVAGSVSVLNKLITASSFRGRYNGEIGDVVVARITEVSQKRWKVDVNSRQDATILLSSVILPGGVQRRKSESDELKMRQFLSEGDLIVAEVQTINSENGLGLHTRSTKYGKLRNGQLVKVPSLLVQRSRSHFLVLSCGVSVILGLNGYIWVSKCINTESEQITEDMIFSSKNEEITDVERESVVRVANCVRALCVASAPINETNISYAYDASLPYETKDLLNTQTAYSVAKEALANSSMV